MKVVKLKAVNIKKIKEIEIEPKGNLILISGKNGQGKTSMMDCLLYALAGKREIPVKPIREGQDKGEITLDLGDIKVIRTFTKNDTYLRVLTKDGAEYPNAQSRLSDLVRNIYFDPMKFAGFDPKEQKQTLLQVIGVDIKTEEDAETRAREERTFVGRMLKQSQGELDGIPAPTDEDRKTKEVSVMELSKSLSGFQMMKRDMEAIDIEIEAKEQKIESLKNQLKLAEEDLANAVESRKVLKETSPFAKDTDQKITEIQGLMQSAEQTNAKVREVQHYAEVEGRVKEHQGNYDEMTTKIEGIQKSKEAKLKEAKMPVEGLSVAEGGVTYNGIPFEQLAKSEQIRVSLAIAMAQDTGLKLIRIMDGSLLDSGNMSVIKEMAEARDYQVWVEVVDESGEVGFFIEDGEVKKEN